jgi:FkbM family methyltransferase
VNTGRVRLSESPESGEIKRIKEKEGEMEGRISGKCRNSTTGVSTKGTSTGPGNGPDPVAGVSAPWFETKDGIRFFHENTPCRQIFYASDYQFGDIGRDDIVLDIGANAGAFCIRASRFSDHVVAVEPLTTEILARNILLNRCRVAVLDLALGDGSATEVTWDGLSKTMTTVTLKNIIDKVGGCDFLKCDCEGAEWLIRPGDLAGIRRIEMELHIPPICGKPNPALLEYIGKNYGFSLDRVPGHGPLGLMGYLHAQRPGSGR